MRILCTGGSGSLGRALIQRFLSLGETVRSLSRCEVRIAELVRDFPSVHALMGDVRDRDRLARAMWGIDTVIHCAALKRVDEGAYHPDEMLKTNVLGTENVIEASLQAGVKRLLFISSDKAVHPQNIYGHSKAMAEAFCVAANSYAHPQGLRIACTRWGNVVGSRGSVVHIWREQIQRDAPIIVTDPRMSRFWLTLGQAVAFIEQALVAMRGGEIFIPVLPSMRLMDLAEAMAPSYRKEIVGLRPGGEKLSERLLSDEEIGRTVRTGGMFVVNPSHHSWDEKIADGIPVPPDFRYDSAENTRWVSVQEMREWLNELS